MQKKILQREHTFFHSHDYYTFVSLLVFFQEQDSSPSRSLTQALTPTMQFPHCVLGHGRAGAILREPRIERRTDGRTVLFEVIFAAEHSATSNETEMEPVDTTWWRPPELCCKARSVRREAKG